MAETEAQYAPNTTNEGVDQSKAPLVVTVVSAAPNQGESQAVPQESYSQGYSAGYAAAQTTPGTRPAPGVHPQAADPHYDDPGSVYMFLILGLFFPICCCIGLCVTDPNRGPRTKAAYNTLRTTTIIYFVILLIIIIANSS